MPQLHLNQADSVLLRGEQIQLRLLEQIWMGLLIVVLLAGTLSVLRCFYTGWLPIYWFQLGLMALYLLATVLRNRMRFTLRVGFVLAFFSVVGVSGIVAFGLLGAGMWWLVLAAILANVFYSRQAGLIYAAAVVLGLSVVAISYVQGWLTLPFDPAEYVRQPLTWVTMLIGCVMLSVFIFTAIATYQRATVELLHEVEASRQQKDTLIKEQQRALAEIRRLQGFIPICAHCRKIRDDKGYWENVEAYVQKNADVQFSHCLCPPCGHELYGDDWDHAMRDLEIEPGNKGSATAVL